eukprot:362251-Chlamydomonas_euryale.AAC.2
MTRGPACPGTARPLLIFAQARSSKDPDASHPPWHAAWHAQARLTHSPSLPNHEAAKIPTQATHHDTRHGMPRHS